MKLILEPYTIVNHCHQSSNSVQFQISVGGQRWTQKAEGPRKIQDCTYICSSWLTTKSSKNQSYPFFSTLSPAPRCFSFGRLLSAVTFNSLLAFLAVDVVGLHPMLRSLRCYQLYTIDHGWVKGGYGCHTWSEWARANLTV